MRLSVAKAFGSVALLLFSVGCSSPPPPPPPPPPPTPAPPPAPKKCNTFRDKCKAKADTRVPIPEGVNFTFQAPKGWSFAKLPDSTVAQASDSGAVMVATSYTSQKPLMRIKKRTKVIESLAQVAGITPGNFKMKMLTQPARNKMSGLNMSLWEISGAKRADASGGMLVVTSEVGGHEFMIVAFAPTDDQDGTSAIMAALDTLAPSVSDEDDAAGDKPAAEGASR